MLEKIKTNYIIKKPLSLLLVNKKLKLIKYNKSLQKKLDITLNDYKEYSGRYIIYESKTRGKEYNKFGILIFEGDYINGEKNGYGAEYYENELIFQGEYLRGHKIKGKEYEKYANYELVFEGKYLNDQRWEGMGKEIIHYEINDKGDKEMIRYEGEYKYGGKNGKGKEYYEYYESYYDHDNMGQLEYKFIKNVLLFEGEYLYGNRYKGKEYDLDGLLTYEGEFKYGERLNGKGKEYKDDELVFEGEYKGGERWNGKGK